MIRKRVRKMLARPAQVMTYVWTTIHGAVTMIVRRPPKT